jgi:hypothetical protein
MQVKIHQRNGDKNNTDLYRKAVQFFIDELIPKTKQEDLALSVVFKKFTGIYKNEFGGCEQLARNKYKIEINSLKTFIEEISSLAHEIVHVKQGVMGKLVMKDVPDGFIWKGKLYKSVDIRKNNLYNDEKLEWENEANELERVLVQKFFSKFLVNEVKTTIYE